MYYKPDDIWDFYGAKTRTEYVDKYVIKGNFHNEVPQDIKESYETAEYLMAHAYYHWPMFDEALRKILGIYEMAIKLKCQSLEISIEVETKNGNKKKKDLAILIDQLIKEKGFPKELKYQLQGIRGLRNILAHPEKHSFMGALSSNTIIRTVNIINQLFLKSDWFHLEQKVLKKTLNESLNFKDELFVLNHNNERLLVCNLKPFFIFKVNNSWVQCWSFERLINNCSNLSFSDIPTSIFLFLKDIEIVGTCVNGIDFNSNLPLELELTKNPINIKKFEDHKFAFKSITDSDKQIFEQLKLTEKYNLIEKFMYKNCWN
ncbi:hypothetical protein MC378_14540 [Polaribacter sp. MSW13]|uniref:DUF4145 domain-containing protein n=1 Tax=Polaribacter marinus TaxID=2916838 RepID=A0A9X1VPJ0_9FLAO|nr:hypothetical protein [Polaribacter marinus]MCI2230394.1 hypothetical protein [Polaribacter marinus]